MQKKPRAGILFLTIMMLWGIIYPQYAFTEEMYDLTVAKYRNRGYNENQYSTV